MGGRFLRGVAYAALALTVTLVSCQGVVDYDDRRAGEAAGLAPMARP